MPITRPWDSPHDDHNTGLNLSYAYDDRYVVGATFGLTASDVFSEATVTRSFRLSRGVGRFGTRAFLRD